MTSKREVEREYNVLIKDAQVKKANGAWIAQQP